MEFWWLHYIVLSINALHLSYTFTTVKTCHCINVVWLNSVALPLLLFCKFYLIVDVCLGSSPLKDVQLTLTMILNCPIPDPMFHRTLVLQPSLCNLLLHLTTKPLLLTSDQTWKVPQTTEWRLTQLTALPKEARHLVRNPKEACHLVLNFIVLD